MRERYIMFTGAVVLAIMQPLTAQFAVAADWQGSYAAQGSCYCIGQLPAHVSSKIIPTPVGGKSVSQVCKRLGSGPGLQKTDGNFNYPFYEDAQCGHGPFVDESANRDTNCVGRLDDSATGCQPLGPRWNLAEAFGSNLLAAQSTQGNGVQSSGDTLNDDAVVSSLVVDSQVSATAAGKELKTTVIRSSSTANRAVKAATSGSAELPENFAGKSVTIGGQRYLQARADLPAVGGIPGSKIVLDDLVFLRDDSSLDPDDLFQGPELAAAAPDEVAQTKVDGKKKLATDVTSNTSSATVVSEPAVIKDRDESAVVRAEEAEKVAARKAAEAKAEKQRQSRIAAEAKAEKQRQARIALEEEHRARDARLAAEAASQQSAERTRKLVAKEKARLRAEQEQKVADNEIAVKPQSSSEQAQTGNPEQQSTTQSSVTAASKSIAELKDRAVVLSETVTKALRLPAQVRASSRNFNYFEAMPASYDVGGTGLMFEGSGQRQARFHLLGRLGVSDEYQEFMVGGGYYLTPATATRVTVVLLAGIEYGTFELRDDVRAPGVSIDFDDAGLHIGASSRIVLNNKFELKAGVGFSSFFGGDALLSGGVYYHITPRLDAMSRFEFGDNDLFGIGIRYYY